MVYLIITGYFPLHALIINNSTHVIFCQAGSAIKRPISLPVSFFHLCHVLRVRTNLQMRWIATKRIIACVHYFKT